MRRRLAPLAQLDATYAEGGNPSLGRRRVGVLSEEGASVTPQWYRCPSCGGAVSPGAAFCPSCGTKFAQPTPGVPHHPTYQPPPQYWAAPPPQGGPTVGDSVKHGFGFGLGFGFSRAVGGCGGCLFMVIALFLFLAVLASLAHH